MVFAVRKSAKLMALLLALALLAGIPAAATGQNSAVPFAWNPDKDFSFPANNANPRGIWSDTTTIWVADHSDSKIYAYSMATKQRDIGKDFDTLSADNSRPNSIWSDGTTMWVQEWRSNKLYAYSMATKQRDANKDFDIPDTVENLRPSSIWSDGNTVWVMMQAGGFDPKIYAYNLATRQRDTSKDFDALSADNSGPSGIWSDGTTMWVADLSDDKIYAYSMATKARDAGKDFDTLGAENHTPLYIWSDGTTIWVVNGFSNTIYAYNLATKQRDTGKDFDTLSAGNSSPSDIWSDRVNLWVTDRFSDKIYAYSLATQQWDADKDFDTLSADNGEPRGIWSDETTMWVADYSSGKIYAYSMATQQRDASKDFDTLYGAGNRRPTGIWSDGTTMWVAGAYIAFQFDTERIFAYSMATKQRDASKDFDTLKAAGNRDPRSIWSDGTTMWVLDNDDGKIYAYSMATKQRDAAKDFNTLRAAGNDRPTGIWSDKTSMLVTNIRVAGSGDTKIYAYNMPGVTTNASRATTRPSDGLKEPEPPPPSTVAAHCITDTSNEDADTVQVNLGETIEDRWSGGCPSVTRGGRMAKYYTFSLPHTTSVDIALGSHLDDYLVLRRGDLGGTIVDRDDDSGPKNDSLITATLPAGGYTIEATTFYMDGVEAEFTLSAAAVERVLYSGLASGKATTGYSPSDTVLDIRLLPTLPLPTLQITITDDDGFGAGQPGAAEMLLQGRIESDVGSPGSVMLAVPKGVWVGHGDIAVHTQTSAEGSSWEEHTAEDELNLLEEEPEGGGGFFGFLGGLSKIISSLVGGDNPLDIIAGWLRVLGGGRTAISGETATMLGLGGNPVSPIFKENYANCFSQVLVPWLVEEKEVTGMRISIPVILTDSEYISVGAEFIARESDDNETSLVQAHDLLSTGQDLPACQRP